MIESEMQPEILILQVFRLRFYIFLCKTFEINVSKR